LANIKAEASGGHRKPLKTNQPYYRERLKRTLRKQLKVSYHHLRRIQAHADFKRLTSTQAAVLKEISDSINADNPKLFTPSMAELGERTIHSEGTVQKAIKALREKGFLGVSKRKHSYQRYSYELLVVCDCVDPAIRAVHLSPAELMLEEARGDKPELPAQGTAPVKLSGGDALSAEEGTYKHPIDIKNNLRPVVSLSSWQGLLEREIQRKENPSTLKAVFKALLKDLEESHQVALAALADERWLSSGGEMGWLTNKLRKAPEIFKPGTENPEFRKKLGETLAIAGYHSTALDNSPAMGKIRADFAKWGSFSTQAVLDALEGVPKSAQVEPDENDKTIAPEMLAFLGGGLGRALP
jgi:DNA-binding MarR family transcriptional regulator